MPLWNAPAGDPHSTPTTTGPIEPAPSAYHGVADGGWNPSATPSDPHDQPFSIGDLGQPGPVGPTPTNITGGPLSGDRSANVVND